jgi:hypothetical protein
MKRISLQYKISLKDFKDAYEHHWKSKKLGTKANIITSMAGVLVAFGISLYNVIVGAVVLSIGCILFAITLLRNFSYRKSYLNSPKFAKEIKVIFSDETIQTETAVGKSELTWDIYSSFTETKDYFLLYMSKNSFSIVPKSALKNNEALEDFRSLMKKKIK